jgi:ATP-dependent RNA helicase DeaD
MTNDMEPHQNGVADDVAALAAVPPATETLETAAVEQPPAEPPLVELPPADLPAAEPAPPSFDDLGLHPDVKLALDEMGYFLPTAVQTAVYRPVSEGKDLLVQSRTGTGKTTAFGLPTISKIIPTHRAPQALILAPTRELALQVARELTQLSKHRGIIVEPIYGGAPIGKQITALRNGVHIIVGTPGRVLDHIGRRTLDCSSVQTFILDECDEMLSMGFLEDIERVVAHIPEKKQTLLFSATMPDEVTRYARRHMRSPEQISLSRDGISVTEIHHAYYIVSGIARSRDLLKILFAEEPESAIIFCNTRDETTMVARFLQKQGLDAEPLSSDLSQADRERVMGRMKQHSLRLLCATDVAARGIDISDLSHVINYSVPEAPEIYVHRTGRTGRAGKTGVALSLVGPRELGNFRYVRLQFGIKPEERLLPKDSIFEGRLKVPLPPIGLPQPPDPVQILIRGTPLTGTGPSELEMKIFEKLLASIAGKRVIAQLVAERLNQLSTRSKPKRPERSERPERSDRGERGEHAVDGGAAAASPGAPAEDRGDRPRFDRDRGDRPDRGERPRADGDRPWRDRDDRGERRFDRDRPRGDGDRPRGDGDRPRGDGDRPRGDGDRPRGDGDRPRGDGDRPRGDGDRPRGDGDRPWRDRDETRGRDRYGRDRGDRPDRGDRADRPDRDRPRDRFEPRTDGVAPIVTDAVAVPQAEGSTPAIAVEARPELEARGDRDRDRDRGRDRGDRGERRFDRDRNRGERRDGGDRDRSDRPRDERRPERSDRPERTDRPEQGERTSAPGEVTERAVERPVERIDLPVERLEAAAHIEPVAEVGTEAAPIVETVETAEAPPTRVDEVARAVLDRVEHRDRGDRKGKRDKKPEPTAETREFWETWAEEKSARAPEPRSEEPEPAPPRAHSVPVEAPAEAAPTDEATEPASERRSRGRDRGRDKDKGRSRSDTKPDKTDRHDKPERASRAKRDTTEAPAKAPVASAAVDGAQARLFVSLGKKHGVSADDLRSLLSGPIGGDKARIGSVSLRDSHAHVRVPEEYVDAIIAGVHGTQHKEHDVTVERART